MNWLIISFQLAVIAYVYAVLLTKPDMLLGGVFGFLTEVANDFPKTEWFLKPLMLCEKCVAGQMALWMLILYGWLELEWVLSVINVLFFLSLTVLLVHVFTKLLHE